MISLHILISWTLLLTMMFLRYSHALCRRPWFGNECENRCRCLQDRCSDTDGTCLAGSRCHFDWFGPSCQYKDFVAVSGRGMPSWLTDKDVRTCQPNNPPEPVSMSFSPAIYFTWLRMEYGRIGNFIIKFNNNTVDCLNKRTYELSRTVADVSCELSTEIYHISIHGDLVWSLCNIYVSGGRNMALRQPTNQTSTCYYKGQTLSSDKAVDGNTEAVAEKCAYTNYTSSVLQRQVWKMFYRQPVILYYALLFNRDIVQYRLARFQLETYGSNNERLQSYNESWTERDIYYVTMTARSQPVSRLSVTSGFDRTDLNICEIETYGDMACTEGKWGPHCEHNCACGRTEFCSPITGTCSPGCTAGFYGPRCDRRCSSLCDNQGCHYETGECFQCVPGYMGRNCDVAVVCTEGKWGPHCEHNCECERTEFCSSITGQCSKCIPGFYGPICDQRCSAFCDNQGCHYATGECFQCVPGYMGRNCDVVCPTGKYGVNCSTPCSDKCLNSECLPTNGSCLSCPDQFYGFDCSQLCSDKCLARECLPTNGSCLSCSNKFYGSECSQPCSDRCLNSECLPTNGSCLSCSNKFYGSECSQPCSDRCLNSECLPTNGSCLSCPDKFYGSECSQPCSDKCDGELCYAQSGVCKTCKIGFFMKLCDVPCNRICANMTCNRDTGYCGSVCPTGTYGVNCSKLCSDKCLTRECLPTNGNCLSCPDKFYGSDCSRPCSGQCHGELCDAQSGVCKICKIGFFTNLCDVPCNRSCENMTCNRDTGYCGSGCPPGKYGPKCLLDCEPNCDVCDDTTCFKCSNWMYGDDCSRLCPQKCGGKTCEMKTGLCLSCVTGYYGDECQKPCPADCEGSACDFQTGKCSASNQQDISAATVIAVFLLLVVFIGCLILFMRKRHPPPSTEEGARKRPAPEITHTEIPISMGTWV